MLNTLKPFAAYVGVVWLWSSDHTHAHFHNDSKLVTFSATLRDQILGTSRWTKAHMNRLQAFGIN